MARKRVLVLFPKEWDRQALACPDCADYELVYEGFDLFRFPGNLRLLTFDAARFVERLVERWRGRIDGVMSNNEYFGALIASVVADRLGLPATPPRAVVTAQHKYYSRVVQRAAAPEAVPAFAAFAHDVRDPAQIGLPFPLFVKPVRATFSVLARRVEDFAALQRHLRFSRFEELIIRRLVRPYADLAPLYADFDVDPLSMLAEAPLAGREVNLDGYVHQGEVRFLGACDAIMFPGTDQFQRFVYPSRVPEGVQARMRGIACRVLRALDYRHGFFNVEMFWDPRADSIKLVEVNARLASQLAGLYQRVDGTDPHRMLLQLATGEAPRYRRRHTGCAIAASLVSRRFDGRALAREPGAADLGRVKALYPDASVMLYLKRGLALAREMKWLGSYRYAVVNLGGADEQDLENRYGEIKKLLGFA